MQRTTDKRDSARFQDFLRFSRIPLSSLERVAPLAANTGCWVAITLVRKTGVVTST